VRRRKQKRVRKKSKANRLNTNPNEKVDLRKQLAFLSSNKRRMLSNDEIYFSEISNQEQIKQYYSSILSDSNEPFINTQALTKLLANTHKNQVPYSISKDLYLYTWVDLYPDGSVKSIYSGEEKNPASLIEEDHEIIELRYKKFIKTLQELGHDDYLPFKKIKTIEWKYKYNTEHIVPQSWFNGLEPMKGDLHHLFTCQPECNISRSNFPYTDFAFYTPESANEPIQNHCGITVNAKFEPEHGKGKCARAMLYFLLRYPHAIKKSFLELIDIPLLVNWHRQFPITLYEKHRNQAIFLIQGNRNPFIDFPRLVDFVEFPMKK